MAYQQQTELQLLDPKTQENIALVQAAIEQVYNQRSKAAAGTYFHPAIAGEISADATSSEKATAFSDLTYTLDAITGQGTLVAAQFTATGTHTGTFKTAAPTGKAVTWCGSFQALVSNGLIVDFQVSEDHLRRKLQVGLLPVPPDLSVAGSWRGLANDGSVEMTLQLSQDLSGNVSGTANYKSMGKEMGTASVSGAVDYPAVSLTSTIGTDTYTFDGLLGWAAKARGNLQITSSPSEATSVHPVKMNRFG